MTERLRKAAAPKHRKVPVEVVRASDKDAPWTPTMASVSGMSNREKAPGQTPD